MIVLFLMGRLSTNNGNVRLLLDYRLSYYLQMLRNIQGHNYQGHKACLLMHMFHFIFVFLTYTPIYNSNDLAILQLKWNTSNYIRIIILLAIELIFFMCFVIRLYIYFLNSK